MQKESGHCANSPGMATSERTASVQPQCSKPTISNHPPQDLLIICVPRYRGAERIAAMYGKGRDWRWFGRFSIATDWLDRCDQRGVPVNPEWILK